MSTLKKCKVVMLSTNQKAPIQKQPVFDKLKISTNPDHDFVGGVYQHLYIISDDDVKEGDWVMCMNENHYKYDDRIFIYKKGEGCKDCKKIIATTDESLNNGFIDDEKFFMDDVVELKKLPQPSEGFLDVYVDFYNRGQPITEVMVEYEEWNKAPHIKDLDFKPWYEPKVNPKDNTITIKKVKDNWNRDEVRHLMLQSFLQGIDRGSSEDFDKWIEENL